VTDGAIVQGVSIALQPVAQSLVRGTVSLPEVYSADGASLRRWLAFPSKELLFLPEQVNRVVIPADRFVVALPWVAGTATWFGVSGHAPKFTGYGWHHRRIDFPPRDQAFSVPPPPDLLNPPESAPVASMTPFRWKTTETGGSSTLFVDCDWSSADPATPDPRHVSYAIETSGTELTLPAIPDLELRPGASCMWSVLWCATANPAEEERCAVSATRTGATP
jgi:hypothetical protein